MYESAIAALGMPENEPINWLVGRALRSLARRNVRASLLDALTGANPSALRAHNAWIGEFRAVLVQPALAAEKAAAELCNPSAGRLSDFLAEVFAVLRLKDSGYSNFVPVIPDGRASAVDFLACRAGRRVQIEIKTFHRPSNTLAAIAHERWNKCRGENPAKYCESYLLGHDHIGPLAPEPASSLRNRIDQLPAMSDGDHSISLPGAIKVTLARLRQQTEGNGPDALMLAEMTKHEPRLIVQSRITIENLGSPYFDDPHGLFLKAIRATADSAPKFFGPGVDSNAENLIACYWNPPNLLAETQTAARVQSAIQGALDAVGLRLSVLILCGDRKPDWAFLPVTGSGG